jgi:hypothetical protein
MVLVRYRSQNLFSLGKWSSQIQAGFHVSDLFGRPFQGRLTNRVRHHIEVLQPRIPKDTVWADPGSLAATTGIFINFFYPGY